MDIDSDKERIAGVEEDAQMQFQCCGVDEKTIEDGDDKPCAANNAQLTNTGDKQAVGQQVATSSTFYFVK